MEGSYIKSGVANVVMFPFSLGKHLWLVCESKVGSGPATRGMWL